MEWMGGLIDKEVKKKSEAMKNLHHSLQYHSIISCKRYEMYVSH